MRVEVYWNLHKRLFSVRALEGKDKGRVIDHVYGITLKDAKFVVQPAGRERVRREGKKNVHAFVRGRLHPDALRYTPPESHRFMGRVNSMLVPHGQKITYNPFAHDTFVELNNKNPVHEANIVALDVMLGEGNPFPRIMAFNKNFCYS